MTPTICFPVASWKATEQSEQNALRLGRFDGDHRGTHLQSVFWRSMPSRSSVRRAHRYLMSLQDGKKLVGGESSLDHPCKPRHTHLMTGRHVLPFSVGDGANSPEKELSAFSSGFPDLAHSKTWGNSHPKLVNDEARDDADDADCHCRLCTIELDTVQLLLTRLDDSAPSHAASCLCLLQIIEQVWAAQACDVPCVLITSMYFP